MLPGIWTQMFFIILNFSHRFKITVSNLECVVDSLKLWELGESINWPFESPVRKGIQDPKACCWCPGSVSVWTPPGGDIEEGTWRQGKKAFFASVCPGFQQLTEFPAWWFHSQDSTQESSHELIVLGWNSCRKLLAYSPWLLGPCWQALLPGVISQRKLQPGQVSQAAPLGG